MFLPAGVYSEATSLKNNPIYMFKNFHGKFFDTQEFECMELNW